MPDEEKREKLQRAHELIAEIQRSLTLADHMLWLRLNVISFAILVEKGKL